RYVAKIYNDQWMMERGFLDVKTFKDLVNARASQQLITVSPEQTVSEAIELMRKHDISNLPVMNGDGFIGSISESGLFNKVIENAEIRNQPVSSVMEKEYPVVNFTMPVDNISHLISKQNGAVLSKDETGTYHIITKYDLIQSLAR
ncbi:MAG: CBS domain-containing protein, partial [Chitinophagaceae bacterium]|nr:CBS domain-containing protein [Chitinophagaceae bacterium]